MNPELCTMELISTATVVCLVLIRKWFSLSRIMLAIFFKFCVPEWFCKITLMVWLTKVWFHV